MKNTAIVAAIAVAVVAAATPYAMGWQAERESAADLQDILDQVPYLVVAQHTYHRGWLTSEEDITLQPAAQMATTIAALSPGAPLQITIHNTIHHGPLPGLSGVGLATIDTRFVPPAGAPDAAVKMLAAAPPLHTELNLFGGGRLAVKDSKRTDAELPLAPGWRISSDGGEFVVNFGRHFDTLDMDLSAPHGRIAKADSFSFEMTGVRLKSRSHRVLRSLYAGSADGSLGDLAISAPMPGDAPRMDFRISAATYHSDVAMAGDFINGGAVLSARSASFSGTQVEGIKLDFAFEHWQADAFERLAAGMRASNRNIAAAPADKATQIMTVMKTAGVALVAHDPVFKITDLEFAMPQGFAKMSGSISVTGAKESDFTAPVNVPALLAKVHAELDISIDNELADKMAHPKPPEADAPKKGPPPPDPLQMLVDQGFVTRDGGKTRTKLVFAGGAVTLNGKPFTPAALHPPAPEPTAPKGKSPSPVTPRR
jgi:uncharacterized protein YdgA (DUF945 family)